MSNKIKQWLSNEGYINTDDLTNMIHDCIQDLGLSNEWVSVDDDAPLGSGSYRVIDSNGRLLTMTYSTQWGSFVTDNSTAGAVTYWQPLPPIAANS